jgi:mono/diheme cytochrome c family protein
MAQAQNYCSGQYLTRRSPMRAHQIITAGADATMAEAVDTMPRHDAYIAMRRERRRWPLNQYRRLFCLSVALALLGSAAAFAQNLENGRRLSERWCSQCHAIGAAPAKFDRAQSFASIAAKDKITTEMIASFLRLPHATMPNVPLKRSDAQDIAAFIMDMKK